MKPLTLLIKPAAGLCNMDCAYCFYKTARAGKENARMTHETADALIQKIRAYRPSALSVAFQGGEPLLAGLPFFRRFILRLKAAVSCPVGFSLQTNGLLIDDAFASFFKEHGFLIGVSLDGDAKTNGRYRKDREGNGVFPRVMNAIGVLQKHGVEFNILSVVDDENAKDIARTYAFFKEQGLSYLQFIPCVDEGNGVSLFPERYEAFLKTLFDLWYDDFVNGRYVSVRSIDNYIRILLGEAPESCANRGVCGGYFVVEADGNVYPCDFYCKDEYLLGTVFDPEPFAFNETYRAFAAPSAAIHAHCRDCAYRVLCRGGCRRDRTEDGTRNVYCNAYQRFFAYAADRLENAARVLLSPVT